MGKRSKKFKGKAKSATKPKVEKPAEVSNSAAKLMDMGFARKQAQAALRCCSTAEAAIQWIVVHGSDSEFEEEAAHASEKPKEANPTEESLESPECPTCPERPECPECQGSLSKAEVKFPPKLTEEAEVKS